MLIYLLSKLKHVSEIYVINPLILSLIITPIAAQDCRKNSTALYGLEQKRTLPCHWQHSGSYGFSKLYSYGSRHYFGYSMGLSSEALANVVIVYGSVLLVYLNIIINKGVLKANSLAWRRGFLSTLFVFGGFLNKSYA
ncbi:MAG: hypothetical protein MZU97_09275 [Bacillus subtilis]|nr:hypothetical protein [Bacillus subtilis]